MKTLSVILLTALTLVGCNDLVENDDQTYPRNTLYLYAGSSSLGDPDYAGIATSLFDNVMLPRKERADIKTETALSQEYVATFTTPQYTNAILDGALYYDNGTRKVVTPGHIAYAVSKLMWSQDLENRSAYYNNTQHFFLSKAPASVLLYDLDDITARFVGWNVTTEFVRTVYQHDTYLRATGATIKGMDTVLTYSEVTPNGRMVISGEKTIDGVQLSGRIYRTLYKSSVHAGTVHTTSNHQLIVFMSRITSVGIRTSLCQLDTTAPDGANCYPDPALLGVTPDCNDTLILQGIPCRVNSTYSHGDLDNTSSVVVSNPDLAVPEFWTSDLGDHFKLSL